MPHTPGISNTNVVTHCSCGEPISTHPRCDGCSILGGPGHVFRVFELKAAVISAESESKELCPLCYQDSQERDYHSWREFYEGKEGRS